MRDEAHEGASLVTMVITMPLQTKGAMFAQGWSECWKECSEFRASAVIEHL